MAFSATKCDTVCDRLSLEDYKSCQIWLPPNKEQGWHAIMAYDIIKNNELVRGKFSLCGTNSTHPSRKEFFPPTTQSISIEQGLDFILSHFEEPIWPRTIFTKTLGKQYTVYSKQKAIARFKQSNLLDCRINAYPDYIGYRGINRQPQNFIFIDIDGWLFRTDKEFWRGVEETCENIEQTWGANPLNCGGEMGFISINQYKR